MRINRDQLLALKKNLIDIAHIHVQEYISDLILDLDYLDRANFNEEVPPLLIFIVRDCGTELGAPESGRIQYYLTQYRHCLVFKIDVEKLVADPEIPTSHYTNLRREDDEECVIYSVPQDQFKLYIQKEGE